jgi:hypothetical protein
MTWSLWSFVFLFFLAMAAVFLSFWPHAIGWAYYPAAGIVGLFFFLLVTLIVVASTDGPRHSHREQDAHAKVDGWREAPRS